MVGPLVILKMLHCKRLKARQMHKLCQKTATRKTDENTNNIPEVTVKDESNKYINSESICRICLKEGTISIYGKYGDEDLSEYINLFCGIDVQQDDIYPKHLCPSCQALLEAAILFRKTAQQSDKVLKQPQCVEDNLESDLYNSCSDDECTNVDEEINISVNDQEPSKYYCKKCDLVFNSQSELQNHRFSDDHENIKKQCPVCKKFVTPSYLKKHSLIHSLSSIYVCDICGKKFIAQGQFSRHRLTHFYSLPYKCSECPYRGRFSESLKMHMRSHTGEKPYQCSECAARFISKSNLNKHMLTHKAEYDFKCETCGRGFYTKRELELHFKVDHTGIKDHICRICGKAFGYRKQMMKHELKVHKRQKLKSGRMPLYLQVEMRNQDGKKMTDN